MGTRRKARMLAMQALYFMDVRKDFSPETFGRFCANFAPKPDMRPFFMRLVEGVLRSQAEIDALIERFSENWSLNRMPAVDRNVMRIAVYELMCCEDIPAKVSINEAVDIGKKFGSDESGAFINGIIDGIREAAEKGELTLPCRDSGELWAGAGADPPSETPPADAAEAEPVPDAPGETGRRRKKIRPIG
jgi:N utilization substance protein B